MSADTDPPSIVASGSLTGVAAEAARGSGVIGFEASLSHQAGLAAAVALALLND